MERHTRIILKSPRCGKGFVLSVISVFYFHFIKSWTNEINQQVLKILRFVWYSLCLSCSFLYSTVECENYNAENKEHMRKVYSKDSIIQYNFKISITVCFHTTIFIHTFLWCLSTYVNCCCLLLCMCYRKSYLTINLFIVLFVFFLGLTYIWCPEKLC